ncbi:hypothetical protein PRZ48_003512 [Zasmidium cellare]|uniref:Uncharacterized protein n=1 Tax=Zasmidium cellare TaxID=395010 RepID=A0ABR0EV90_ZASCE|nr:hypothetical protein PRZ48_003512 [Zasmidium cellare]
MSTGADLLSMGLNGDRSKPLADIALPRGLHDLYLRTLYLKERLRLDLQEYHRISANSRSDTTLLEEAWAECLRSKAKLDEAILALWTQMAEKERDGGEYRYMET